MRVMQKCGVPSALVHAFPANRVRDLFWPVRWDTVLCWKRRRDVMHLAMPLQQMSATEKLQAIEELWADLVRESENVPSPAWHGDVLCAREQRIAEGSSRFLDVAAAKQAVREQLK